MDKESISRKRSDGWIEAWFAIEALAVNKDVAEEALRKHVEKLARAPDVFVYEAKYSEVEKVENPLKDVKEGYSQVADIKLFIKNIPTLVYIVLVYGPSSVEIIGPGRKEIKIDELQNMANLLSGLVHQFASAGMGGIVISPK